MKCQRVKEEIKAYVDGELGRVTRWRLARHLAACAGCRMEEKTMTDLAGQVQGASKAAAPPGLRGKVLGKIEFKPGARRRKWILIAVPAAGLGALVVAAILFPVFAGSHERARIAPLLAARRSRQAAERALPSMPFPTRAQGPKEQLAKAKVNTPWAPSARRPAPQAGDRGYGAVAPPSVPTTPLIIKTADISIKVKSFQKAYDDAVWICRSVGGFVSDSTAESEESIPTSGSLTLRVPVDSFESAIGRLSRLGTVKSKNIKGQDVTGEVVDLESRLRNKRAEERQYLEIMNRAKRVPDILTVTEELSRVRGEIEEAQGRLKYLRASAAMATINVSLSEKERPKPVPASKSSITRTFKNAVASLGRTANGLAAICIWLGVYSPFWALPIAAWLYLRKRQPAAQ